MTQTLAKTNKAIQRGIDTGQHLGAQLCVIRRGEVHCNAAFGHARRGVVMSPDTLMPWMSAGKPITSVAILQLVEQGKLALKQPVVEVIPEFAAHGKEAITLKHLLTHTAGLRLVETGWPDVSWDEMVRYAVNARIKRDWDAQSRGAYDTEIAWIVLGELVRRVSGERVNRYLRTHVLEPLGMDHCWVGMPGATYHAYGERLGVMHAPKANELAPLNWHTLRALGTPNPGRNTVGPAHQIAKLYQTFLNGGGLHEQRVLSEASTQDLLTRHREGVFDETFQHRMDFGLGVICNLPEAADRATMPYGFGQHVSPDTFGHGGHGSSLVLADPQQQLVVACVFNGVLETAAHRQRVNTLMDALQQDMKEIKSV